MILPSWDPEKVQDDRRRDTAAHAGRWGRQAKAFRRGEADGFLGLKPSAKGRRSAALAYEAGLVLGRQHRAAYEAVPGP